MVVGFPRVLFPSVWTIFNDVLPRFSRLTGSSGEARQKFTCASGDLQSSLGTVRWGKDPFKRGYTQKRTHYMINLYKVYMGLLIKGTIPGIPRVAFETSLTQTKKQSWAPIFHLQPCVHRWRGRRFFVFPVLHHGSCHLERGLSQPGWQDEDKEFIDQNYWYFENSITCWFFSRTKAACHTPNSAT